MKYFFKKSFLYASTCQLGGQAKTRKAYGQFENRSVNRAKMNVF